MSLDAELRATLLQRREKLLAAGGDKKIKERHDKGLMTARERFDAFFQPDTFQEYGAHIRHGCSAFDMADKDIPADGVVVGTGHVEGRQVAAFSQDFMSVGGTLGKMHARKIVWAQDYALKNGTPLVGFKDSGGARIQEGVDALSGYGEVFYRNVELSGVVPQIAIIAGPCAGGAAYSPALMDFIIMTRTNAQMFITGPQVIKAVSGRDVSMNDVGGADMHAAVSGNVHLLAENDAHAIALAQQLLSYLPSNNTADPPHAPRPEIDFGPDEGMDALVESDPSTPMNMHAILRRVLDGGELFEIHASFARNLIVGFGRIEGLVVGVLANNSMEKAGCLDIDSSDKGARFIRFCNAFNIPLVTFVDVPGFLPGIDQERGGIIRHGAKMLFSYAAATVPKVTVVARKAYGGSYLAMCSQEMGADVVFAWPTAEIAVMGADGAVNILYSRELKAIEDPELKKAKRKEFVEHYRAEFASPYLAASKGYITDIIEPEMTRAMVSLGLRKLLAKRELRPPKKHGLIPL
ncbi:acyl-CoA carboxylase subunit beta [Blastochloris tepida]|uniref:Methylmalonyl-CoA carboxyltransferase n=1 Tax=Blastochloris tepida TaxID=2233851 RepID=A0A348G1S9_9HYPH|nr:acyl-CoA carboxylase subunit beta [Blastochloris tepida]BBF93512.1 methylmalonyl-CoA carboxyltransferase [Blastochloris tepida]